MFAKPLFQPTFHPLVRLPIQFFSDPGGDPDDDDDDTNPDDEPNLAELIKKDPKLKKQYQELLKTQLGKRMKKFEDVDVEEYRQLKEKAEKGKDKGKGSDKEDHDDADELKSELKAKEEKLLRAERREKRATVKEFAIDNGVDPKLLARLINVDAIELDEDGEPENLDELFEELQEEFPQYLKAQEESDEEEDQRTTKKKGFYSAGSTQKGNTKPKEKDGYDVGVASYQRVMAKRNRNKKED
ncbi:hypothetical protein [Priestia megaterium]|uniref:hypothetical protein n=1 Tax=Priestia megaterium TaxID=1404 RepID=UPI002813C98A|nr:hypothetical protein [Priestia megaterium]MDR0128680.1 hypothetical protein [Priestia megaterium]